MVRKQTLLTIAHCGVTLCCSGLPSAAAEHTRWADNMTMKLTSIVFGVVILGVGVAAQVSGPSSTFLIERHKVGSISISDSAQSVYERYGRARVRLVDLGLEGFLTPALEVMPPGAARRDSIVVELDCRGQLTVYRILIKSSEFHTSKNVGVGSSVGELRRAYKLDSVVVGEGTLGIRVEEISATFVLKQPKTPPVWLETKNPAAIPDEIIIERILLT